jgi:DNA polymerase I-like protein with 3'-5' exonuclease and polymerase domains
MAKKSTMRSVGGLQLPLIAPECTWKIPSLSDLPPDWNVSKRVGFDVETRDEDLKTLGIGVRRPGNYMVGYSFAFEDGPSYYVPLRHEGGGNMEHTEAALQYLRDQTRNYKGIVVGANIQYDLDYLMEEGGNFDQAKWIRDVQIADPLIYELHQSYSLKSIAERLSVGTKDQAMLEEAARAYGLDPKNGLWRLPGQYVGQYAATDAALPLTILRLQERRIDAMDLWDIYNLESQVTPVLVKMRRRGIRIDFQQLETMENWASEEEHKALNEVERITGYQVGFGNVWKSEAMAEPLRRIGLTIPVTAQGKDSIDKDFMSGIDHPVAKHLARARKVNKLRTTFAASVRRYMVNGRIHCTFNQIRGDEGGARYGRLSCSDPNLQQQPSRDEFAKPWRKSYLPEEWGLWCSNDYSQQEPRWTTHFAASFPFDHAHIRESALRAAKVYNDDPNADNHDMMTRIVFGDEWVAQADKDAYKAARTSCKIIYLGLCYGEGGAKLCDDLGLPTRYAVAYKDVNRTRVIEYFETEADAFRRNNEVAGFCWRAAGEEGQRILDQFNENAPHIGALAKEATKIADGRGYITTILGRRLNFEPESGGKGGYRWTHKTLNRIIQGSSADQTKKAIVEIDRAGHFVQLQVHDEIACTVKDESEARAIADIMRTCVPALVPFKVDTEIGSSWGHSMG